MKFVELTSSDLSSCMQLLGLQMRVRSEVAAELHLQQICGSPDAMLFDWGLMRLRRNMSALSGQDASLIPGVSSSETDERLRRKRKAEVCIFKTSNLLKYDCFAS